jgi:hypothetical protein
LRGVIVQNLDHFSALKAKKKRALMNLNKSESKRLATRDLKIAIAAYKIAARFKSLNKITRKLVGFVRAYRVDELPDT